MNEQRASIANLLVEIDISAPPDAVWKGLTDDIGQWWPADFYTGGAAHARNMEIELTLGGRMFESWDAGGGTLWGTVVSFEPYKLLQVVGVQFPEWGGPSQWYGSWRLEAVGDKTKLSFSEATLGRVTDSGLEQKTSGWQFLSACLKAFLEDKPAPQWPA